MKNTGMKTTPSAKAPNYDPSNNVKRATDLGIGKGKTSVKATQGASMKGGKSF